MPALAVDFNSETKTKGRAKNSETYFLVNFNALKAGDNVEHTHCYDEN